MCDVLFNVSYFGFIGIFIEKMDVNIFVVFGNYVDIYDILQVVEDGVIVCIYYESCFVKIVISDEGCQFIEDFDDEFNEDELIFIQKECFKWVRIEGLIGSLKCIKVIVVDMVQYFEQCLKFNVDYGKGMIVIMFCCIVVEVYKEIIVLKFEWYSDDLNDGVIKVVMIFFVVDGLEIVKYYIIKKECQVLVNCMKDDDDKLKLVIVCDMWLIGFDVFSMYMLYIDKLMKGYNFMQVIVCVNCVYKDKIGGLVVDYLGIVFDLKEVFFFYFDVGGCGDFVEVQEEVVMFMQEKLEILEGMMYGYDYKVYFVVIIL